MLASHHPWGVFTYHAFRSVHELPVVGGGGSEHGERVPRSAQERYGRRCSRLMQAVVQAEQDAAEKI